MTCPTQLADAWRQRSGNDQARLIENHGPRRRAVPSPHLTNPGRFALLLTGHKRRAIFGRSNIIHEQELLNAGNQLVAYLEPAAPTENGAARG